MVEEKLILQGDPKNHNFQHRTSSRPWTNDTDATMPLQKVNTGVEMKRGEVSSADSTQNSAHQLTEQAPSSHEPSSYEPFAVPAAQHFSEAHSADNLSSYAPTVTSSSFFDGSYSEQYEEQGKPHKALIQHSLFTTIARIPRWRWFYTSSLVLLDAAMMCLALALSILLALGVFHSEKSANLLAYLTYAVLFVLSWVLCLYLVKSYERHLMGEGYNLYARIMTAGCIEFIVLCTCGYLAKYYFSRGILTSAVVLAVFFTMIERWLMRRYLYRNRRRGEFDYATVLVGSPQGISSMIYQLTSGKGQASGYKPIAICPVMKFPAADGKHHYRTYSSEELAQLDHDNQLDNLFDFPLIPFNSRFAERARFHGAQTVLITDVLNIDSEMTRAFSLAVEARELELAMSASVAHIAGSNIILRQQSVMPILSASLSQYSLPTRIIKRFMDIIGSLVALIPTCLLIAIFGIAIKLEDGGPIFYAQERVGLYGRPFKIFKLRSMKVNADKLDAQLAAQEGVELGATFKVKEDPRVTKVGKFIRKTSIDEFPQFFNVLKGDMSLVGPRPQRDYEVASYNSLYSTRLLVKPGITGPWQIGGRSNLSPEEAEVLDVNYVENWSVLTDVAILIKTVGAVLHGDGAY